MTLLDPSTLRLSTGVNWSLEDQADEMLNDDRRRCRREKIESGDWLSKDQLMMRQSREVGNELGVCDPSLRQGIFRRAHNGNMGKRPNGHGKSED